MTARNGTSSDFTARMQAAKDMHRARGTTGGAGGPRSIGRAELRAREAGLTAEQRIETRLYQIWNEGMRLIRDQANRPLLTTEESENECPF